MNKLKALVFTIKCFCWIFVRVLFSRDWNVFTLSLNDGDGDRRMIRYQKQCGSIDLASWIKHSDGSTTFLGEKA